MCSLRIDRQLPLPNITLCSCIIWVTDRQTYLHRCASVREALASEWPQVKGFREKDKLYKLSIKNSTIWDTEQRQPKSFHKEVQFGASANLLVLFQDSWNHPEVQTPTGKLHRNWKHLRLRSEAEHDCSVSSETDNQNGHNHRTL